MNTREAKFILQAYRPGGQDAGDPQFSEALHLAQQEPELGKWFAEQLAFDLAVSRSLNEVKAPNQLRESILAGKHVMEPSNWWKRPVWWAMAASLLLLLGLARFLLNSENTAQFASYRQDMAAASANMVGHLDIETNDANQVQAWLASHQAETNFDLPAGLRGVPSMGCRVIDWRGHKVSMLCYVLQGAKHVDLFVTRNSAFPADGSQANPQFAKTGAMTTASWTKDGRSYLLMGNADETFLRNYLESKSLAKRRTQPQERLLFAAWFPAG